MYKLIPEGKSSIIPNLMIDRKTERNQCLARSCRYHIKTEALSSLVTSQNHKYRFIRAFVKPVLAIKGWCSPLPLLNSAMLSKLMKFQTIYLCWSDTFRADVLVCVLLLVSKLKLKTRNQQLFYKSSALAGFLKMFFTGERCHLVLRWKK